jgi:hypothetical protein
MELSDATEKKPGGIGNRSLDFRLVAQYLNHYATPGPAVRNIYRYIYIYIYIYIYMTLGGKTWLDDM